MLAEFTTVPRVAYFSMEIALRPEIHTYAGGLGILAGDTMRSCADLELNMVVVSLVSHAGYFLQTIDERGCQQEDIDPWNPADWAQPLDAKITVSIQGRKVWVGGWLFRLQGRGGGEQPVILLDTDLNENQDDDRKLTHYLYGDSEIYRLKQEMVLGIGGVRILQALGFRIFHYHLNEGHSALLAVELLRRNARGQSDLRKGESPYSVADVRERCSFTTHTPIEAGHDKFSYTLVRDVLTDFIDLHIIEDLAGSDVMNMTRLALNLSETINGVTQRHAEISRQQFPQYAVRAITNGVHPTTWTCPSMAALYDRYFPGWGHEPELLVRADCCLPAEEIWSAHAEAKRQLLAKINTVNQVQFDPDVFLLGFARRMTAYKRPDLLFSDLQRLSAIAQTRPLQIVLAGKAHPADLGGKQLIETLHHHIRELAADINIAFIPNYGMATALALVSGVDLWLNTPMPPLEASGTSGMKAAFNGVPNFSVLDGWWREGCIEGVTGWSIGEADASDPAKDTYSLYQKLEQIILPLYYDDREGWIKVMHGAISKNASVFNSHRMMRRYVTEAYIK